MTERDPRIAHINLACGYRGGERQTHLLIEGLAERGWHQRLIGYHDEPLASVCGSIRGVEVVEVHGKFSVVPALRGCDLVHVHEGRGTPAAFLNDLLHGVPYVVTRRIFKGPRRSLANRLMYRRAARVVAISEAVRGSIAALDPGLDCEVIKDATGHLKSDPSRVAALRQQFGGNHVVGHVGALDDSHKGQRQIVALARRLAEREPDISFVMVGSGWDEKKLKAESADLPNVRFSGQVSDVGNYLAAFDTFLYPSRHEGLGSVLLDAMAYGLPVIATAVGGIPEIIEHNVNGVLCDVDDIGAMSAAILKLRRDPVLHETIAATNRRTAEHYLPSRMTEQYVDLYARLAPVSGRERVVW